MKRILLLVCAVAIAGCTKVTSVTSPDGHIGVEFSLVEGVPFYSVSVDGSPFVETSKLGLVADGVNLSDGFILKSSKRTSFREVWHQKWGENKEIEDSHKELSLKLENADGVALNLVFRVFDDGLGFRYSYNAPADTLTILDENTEFRFSADGDSWSIPGDFNSYEHSYRKMLLSEIRTANTPMTFRLPDGLHGSVHEAALYDFPEMVLRHTEGTAFKAELAPIKQGPRRRRGAPEAATAVQPRAIVPGTFSTSWRTIQIASSAVGLVNSSLILNLNEPCAIEDVSWIRPMKYIGVWWGMHLGVESWGVGPQHGATTENAIRYIDFAAANNIQGVLFEGWNNAWRGGDALPDFDFTKAAADFDVEKVVAYAREKGVEYITHNETGGNYLRYEAQLEKDLDWAESLGISGMKTGYAGGGLSSGSPRHSQKGVRHFQRVVEEAAKRHIVVDAHEVIKPTGIRRTWPNFMTRECARGMEYNGWSAGNAPSHHEILPYTRLLGGPMDYTPGVFDVLYRNIQGRPQVRTWGKPGTECRVNTTLCKQIANWVILYSPLQMACDLLEAYENHPAFQFFRDFDADCDASEALQGEVGEYIALVRRSGERYFYAATTDETARTLTQPLSFLKEGVTYMADIYADAADASMEENPYAYVIHHREVTSGDTLTVSLATSGGQAIVFTPLK